MKQSTKLTLTSLICLSFITQVAPGYAFQPFSQSPEEQLPQQSLAQVGESAYTLGAGDRIRITVFQLEQYSGEYDILVDGTVNLPIVGSVLVEGMTLAQATEAITAGYSPILQRPAITVGLVSRRAIQIGVAGEVNRPGSYTITPQGGNFPSLTQLLEEAGGIRMTADLSRVQIRRPGNGSIQTVTVDLLQLLRTGSLNSDLPLRDGDEIFVPTATNPDLTVARELTEASFAADETREINIVVVGEVFRPGPYVVTGSARTGVAGIPGGVNNAGRLPTVTRAIQVAGGIRPLADVRNVQVRRSTRTGDDQVIELDLWQLLRTGDIDQDLVLQEGDTIVIPTAIAINEEEAGQLAAASFSPDTIRVNVVGEVERPGVVEIPPNTPLNQGVLAAGGFSNRASTGTVELVRVNTNGTISAREIPVDFAQGISEDLNPTLQNNDVIVVRRSTLAGVSDTLGAIVDPVARFLTLFGAPFRLFQLLD